MNNLRNHGVRGSGKDCDTKTTNQIIKTWKLWIAWLFVCGVVLFTLIPNLSLWPLITQDEVQILDQGRVILNPSTDWGIAWLVHESIPFFGLSYVGIALQETAFNLFESSNFGPRLASLIGAIFSASMILGWLTRRDVPYAVALVLSLVFLLDPFFNSSYRQGRVDCWAIGVCIAACWLIQTSIVRLKLKSNFWPHLFWAGTFTGFAPFVWPTALVIYPLIALELFNLIREPWQAQKKSVNTDLVKIVLPFFLGCLITFLVLFIPVISEWESQKVSLLASMHIQHVASVIRYSIVDMYAINSPFLLVITLSSLLIHRDWGLIVAFIVALLLITQTMIYPMRVIYLMPYILAVVGASYLKVTKINDFSIIKLLTFTVLTVLVVWNFSVTMIKRPLIAHLQSDARSILQIQNALSGVIGSGPKRVLLEEWDTYYAARALGWKSYKIFGRFYKSHEDYQRFLTSMDYVVTREKNLWLKSITPSELQNAGFEHIEKISFKRSGVNHKVFGFLNLAPPKSLYEDIDIYVNKVD